MSIRSMTAHYFLARLRRATTAPRIARDASPGERLVGARPRSLAGPRLLLGRWMASAVVIRIISGAVTGRQVCSQKLTQDRTPQRFS
jgi:hypothetical protein